MKPTTKDEVIGYVKCLVHFYHENQNRISYEKDLFILAEPLTTGFRVVLGYNSEIIRNDLNDDAIRAYDYFTWLKSESLTKLEKYVNGSLDIVTKNEVVITNKISA